MERMQLIGNSRAGKHRKAQVKPAVQNRNAAPKGREPMQRKENHLSASREQRLREFLTHERNTELAKIRDLRREQQDSRLTVPGDELEVARSISDQDLHASLIDRTENRLKQIDAALAQLEQNSYGICEVCGNDISVERLQALPFATLCVDDASRMERGRERGSIGEPFSHRWTPPEEMADVADDGPTPAEDDLPIRNSAFGPEDDELEQMQQSQAPRRRGRPRKYPARAAG